MAHAALRPRRGRRGSSCALTSDGDGAARCQVREFIDREQMVDAVRSSRDGTGTWSASASRDPSDGGKVVADPMNLGDGWVGFDTRRSSASPPRSSTTPCMQAVGSYEAVACCSSASGTGLGSTLIADGGDRADSSSARSSAPQGDYRGLRGRARARRSSARRVEAGGLRDGRAVQSGDGAGRDRARRERRRRARRAASPAAGAGPTRTPSPAGSASGPRLRSSRLDAATRRRQRGLGACGVPPAASASRRRVRSSCSASATETRSAWSASRRLATRRAK